MNKQQFINSFIREKNTQRKSKNDYYYTDENNNKIYRYYNTNIFTLTNDKNIILDLSYNSVSTTKRINLLLELFNSSYRVKARNFNYVLYNIRTNLLIGLNSNKIKLEGKIIKEL